MITTSFTSSDHVFHIHSEQEFVKAYKHIIGWYFSSQKELIL